MPKISTKTAAAKVRKPHKDYPLTPHPSGRWCKKIKGKLFYFGKLDNPDAALTKYLATKDTIILTGRMPITDNRPGQLTVRDLVNHFLTAKDLMVQSGELSPHTRQDYFETCERIVEAFGRERVVSSLGAADFDALRASMAKTLSKGSLGNEINRVRIVFNYADDEHAGLLDRPVRFGPNFKRPSRKILRQERAEKGKVVFLPAELQKLIKGAGVQMRAMLLLAINCGLGNSDCGQLRFKNIDLMNGWLNYPRPKTAVPRRAKLWKETVTALKAAIDARREPKDETNRDLVFVTKAGGSWYKTTPDSPVSNEFTKLMNELKIPRARRTFYILRHMTETVGGEAKDQVAVDYIMGHAPHSSDMSAVYREEISDQRLEAVAKHIHGWLWPKGGRRRSS